jgi:hypothetical protein
MTRLALMTDAQARACLGEFVEGDARAKGRYHLELINSQTALRKVLNQARAIDPDLKVQLLKINDSLEAVRALFVAMAGDRSLRPRLGVWIAKGGTPSGRAVLAEPITTALVLAGVVFALSPDIDVKIERGRITAHLRRSAQQM